MKSLVIFDSNFGNTKIIAEAIAKEFGKDSKAVPVSGLNKKDLAGIKLLVAGSPIHGWRPSEKMGVFLNSLLKDELKGIKAASFDTRVNFFFHGDATKKISKKLKEAGAEIITEPKAFFVKGREGPLADDEVKNAEDWARMIKSKVIIDSKKTA